MSETETKSKWVVHVKPKNEGGLYGGFQFGKQETNEDTVNKNNALTLSDSDQSPAGGHFFQSELTWPLEPSK